MPKYPVSVISKGAENGWFDANCSRGVTLNWGLSSITPNAPTTDSISPRTVGVVQVFVFFFFGRLVLARVIRGPCSIRGMLAFALALLFGSQIRTQRMIPPKRDHDHFLNCSSIST